MPQECIAKHMLKRKGNTDTHKTTAEAVLSIICSMQRVETTQILVSSSVGEQNMIEKETSYGHSKRSTFSKSHLTASDIYQDPDAGIDMFFCFFVFCFIPTILYL